LVHWCTSVCDAEFGPEERPDNGFDHLVEGEKLHEFSGTLPRFSFLFWSEFPKPRPEPEMGGMVLMLDVFLWLTSHSPVRNAAIVDALIAGLCILSVTPLLSLWMIDVRSVYAAYLFWGGLWCGSQ
jgi:hypothetical protein